VGSNSDEVVSWSSSCIAALIGLIGSSHTGMAGSYLVDLNLLLAAAAAAGVSLP